LDEIGERMHENSQRLMKTILAPYYAGRYAMPLTVVDYGSMEHPAGPGTYRSVMPPGWLYTGCHLEAGPNVDLVMIDEYDTGLDPDSVDIVISGQCLEHVRNPFNAVAEMARILKPQGLMVLIAPFAWEVHRYPVDCWRFCPDGMISLMEASGVQASVAEISERDCYAIGVKS
jgi:SAM-dependent methyltransferase